MTSRIRIGLGAAAAALLAGGAILYAHPGGGGGPMKMFDSDGNGAVSLAEAQSGAEKLFAAADADRDGRVTEAELRAFHGRMMAGHERGPHGGPHGGHGGPPPGGGEGREGPMHLDSDGDGAITLAEARSGIEQHFARIDSDRDGSITEAEMRSAHEAHEAHRR